MTVHWLGLLIYKRMIRTLYFILGFVSLVFVYIGILLPGVPAIPFIILSFYCFTKSSEAWVAKLEQGSLTGKLLKKLNKNSSKPWFFWFVISQFWVSMIVAERMFVHSFYWSSLWYLLTLLMSAAIFYLLKLSSRNANQD